MGAFFANLQIKSTDTDSCYEQKIIDCIIQYYRDRGYDIVEGEEVADKSIIVAHEKSTRWYSIYDDDFELNPKELTQLTTFLSGALNTNVVNTSVGDSDYLKISLYNNAKEVCSIDNFNDDLSFTFSELNNWLLILTEGKTIEDISNIFKKNEILVERYLDHLAPLFEISPLYWVLGYTYFEEIMPNDGIKLHFAKKEKEKVETPTQPNLAFAAYGTQYKLKVGEPHPISFQITSRGASATGISIMLVGDAIENEMIDSEKVQVKINGTEYRREAVLAKTNSTDNRKLFVAELKDVIIPEGTLLSPNASTKEYKKYTEEMYKSAIILDMELVGVKQGSTSFSVFVVPLPQGSGQFAYCEIELTVE